MSSKPFTGRLTTALAPQRCLYRKLSQVTLTTILMSMVVCLLPVSEVKADNGEGQPTFEPNTVLSEVPELDIAQNVLLQLDPPQVTSSQELPELDIAQNALLSEALSETKPNTLVKQLQ